jgi:hypothetical protein
MSLCHLPTKPGVLPTTGESTVNHLGESGADARDRRLRWDEQNIADTEIGKDSLMCVRRWHCWGSMTDQAV